MRIFLICQQSLRHHAVPAYAFWERYFKEGIAEAGHTWVEAPGVDWAEGLLPLSRDDRASWMERTWTQAVASFKSLHARDPVDLVLCYLFPSQVDPAFVAEIRALGVPCVNFFCDNVREFTRIPDTFRAFDLHWVPEAEARPLYARDAMPFVYAPMPVWIPPAHRTLPEKELPQTTFIGSHDALREDLLARAVTDHAFDVRIHGPGWSGSGAPVAADRTLSAKLRNQVSFVREHGFRGLAMKFTYARHRPIDRAWLASALAPAIFGDDYFRLTRESAVVIGVNRYPSFRHPFHRPHTYSRLRDIEAPMLGACYLTEMAPGLTDLFEPGEEIEVYANASELTDKAAALRADHARRRKLRENAQRRALNEHTIGRSLEKIARALDLK